jgi:hypothetical protein
MQKRLLMSSTCYRTNPVGFNFGSRQSLYREARLRLEKVRGLVMKSLDFNTVWRSTCMRRTALNQVSFP